MLVHTLCPIDGTDTFDAEVYPASFDLSQLTAETFSARRRPDRVHYRMVRNTRSGCLRADPILSDEILLHFYRESKITYESMARYATETYLHYLHRTLPFLLDRRGVLEIGCGYGFFLERLPLFGFDKLAGIEPSLEAVAKAGPVIRQCIILGTLQPELFAPETFSLVCGFQVLDHLPYPNASLQTCRRLLSRGGIMYWICHDIGSWFARVLGQRCPMIDIEHVVLYDRKTITQLFAKNGFEVLEVFGVSNRYPLEYWLHLAPVSEPVRHRLLGALKLMRLNGRCLSANFGNMGIIARKPASG